MKVLYVDDDFEDSIIFLDAIRSISETIELDYAKSFEDAMYKLKCNKKPAIIFLDINMPLKDGKACLRAIKTNPLLNTIPIIMYSTSNKPEEIRECMDLGASGYLVKPNDFRTLCEQLKRLLIRCGKIENSNSSL